MINTIILDIGNVLAKFRWEEFLQECGYEEKMIHRIGKATVRSNRWKEWDRSSLPEEELMKQCIQADPDIEKEIKTLFSHVDQLVQEYPYSEDFVKRLKNNGYRIYLLSNYSRKMFLVDQHKFSFLNHVDGGVISYQVQYIKPEPQIYQALIEQYQINPSEAVFLDDLQENLDGAKPFGFHTILVKSHEQALEELIKLKVQV